MDTSDAVLEDMLDLGLEDMLELGLDMPDLDLEGMLDLVLVGNEHAGDPFEAASGGCDVHVHEHVHGAHEPDAGRVEGDDLGPRESGHIHVSYPYFYVHDCRNGFYHDLLTSWS